MRKVNEAVYELTGRKNAAILKMSASDLIEQVILPEIVVVGGQDIRGWRISDAFMDLMAQYGEELRSGDSYRGGILYEIAMQRISCGAVLHEATPVWDALPKPYRKYSAYYDQPGLMSKSCFNFLQRQAENVLRYADQERALHMQKILFGIIDHLNSAGQELKGYMLGQEVDGAKVYAMAWITLCRCRMEQLWRHLATPQGWEGHRMFFREYWNCIDPREFARLIGITGPFKAWRAKRKVF